MRSIWKGHIRFSLVTIPIQVFSAAESKGNISFKQLHGTDNGRIGYKKVCKHCDEEVAHADIVKGYEYGKDQYVVLQPEELDSIKLKSNRAIEIEAFVDLEQVHPTRFEAVYFIGPDGEIAKQTFSLFNQTLTKTGKAGIGRLILRDREDVMLLTPQGDGIIMYKLRYPYEIRDIKNVPDLALMPVAEDQLKLAETLVGTMSKNFDEIDFSDRYKEALQEIVEAKIAGKEIIKIVEEEDQPVVDIMSALKDSIEKAKELKKSA